VFAGSRRRVRMKTTKIIVLTGALVALAGCATSESPWRVQRKPVAAAAPACADFQSSVYFEQDSADLTQEARTLLANAKTQAHGCAVKSVRVIGLADAVGTTEANLILSRRRAATVTSALAKVGFSKVEIDAVAVGDTGAVAASGAAAPLRRRADVLFDLEGK
jgi:peptidoglycan-associated lipoprotein